MYTEQSPERQEPDASVNPDLFRGLAPADCEEKLAAVAPDRFRRLARKFATIKLPDLEIRKGGEVTETIGGRTLRDELLPVIPPGATPSEGSKIRPDQIGKVPGRLNSQGTGWFSWNWNDPKSRTTDADIERCALWDTGAGAGLRARSMQIIDGDIKVPAGCHPALVPLYEALATEIRDATIAEMGPSKIRIGEAPAFALFYLSPMPMPKEVVSVELPDGHGAKVEILGDGEFLVLEGVHPKRLEPYSWPQGRLSNDDAEIVGASLEQRHCFVECVKAIFAAYGPKFLAVMDQHKIAPVSREAKVARSVGAGRDMEKRAAPAWFKGADNDDAIQAAVAYLAVAPASVQHQGGDANALKVANACLDLGVSEDKCIELMEEIWYPRCTPSDKPKFVARKVHNAASYRLNDIGCDARRDPRDAFKEQMGAEDQRRREEAKDDGEAKAEHRQSSGNGLILMRASEIKPKKLRWLWRDYLALGVLHMMAGMPETGKTTCAIKFAATISQGGEWPDGTTAEKGDVILWLGEDLAEQTILPRLWAAGADLDRVHIVRGVREGEATRAFDPAVHMVQLMEAARMLRDLKMIIVEPVVIIVSGDDHKNNTTRRGLEMLVILAEKLNIAVVGISHFTKGTQGRLPIERLTGSLAYGAVTRILLAFVRSENGRDCRMVRAKANIGRPSGNGFDYTLPVTIVPTDEGDDDSVYVKWGKPCLGSARRLIEEIEQDKKRKPMGQWILRAMSLLDRELANGPRLLMELEEIARGEGIAPRALREAKAVMGNVDHRNTYFGGPYEWFLKPDAAPTSAPADAVPF